MLMHGRKKNKLLNDRMKEKMCEVTTREQVNWGPSIRLSTKRSGKSIAANCINEKKILNDLSLSLHPSF